MIFKSISRLTAFLLISLIPLSSCQIEEITPSTSDGKINLVLDLTEISSAEARIISPRIENIEQLYLTIQTKDGKPTAITRSAASFSWVNQTLVAKGISLSPDKYQVTEILVKDYTDDIVYAGPLMDSKISLSASSSLPLHFEVLPDKEEQLGAAVVSTLGHRPADFGFEGSDILFKDEAACEEGVHEGDVRLGTQEEINEFGSHCYTGIKGSLWINVYDKLLDLSPLKSLKFIEEGLLIREHEKRPEWNDMEKDYLLSLHGLHNVEYIGVIMLNDLTSIKSLEGFRGLKEVKDIHIADLPKLENLRGLENLAKCRMLRIGKCDGLIDLKGLDKIEEFTLQLNSNPVLTNLHGIPKLKKLNGFSLYQNKKIESLSGLFEKNPLSIETIHLTDSGLKDLKGLFSEDLKVTKSLGLDNNSKLLSLDGLWVAQEGMEVINISRHKNMNDISALSMVKNVDRLRIDRNEKLENLNGLQNISDFSYTSSREFIEVIQNPILKDLCGVHTLLVNHPTVNYKVEENAYNPTAQDIIERKCSL